MIAEVMHQWMACNQKMYQRVACFQEMKRERVVYDLSKWKVQELCEDETNENGLVTEHDVMNWTELRNTWNKKM